MIVVIWHCSIKLYSFIGDGASATHKLAAILA